MDPDGRGGRANLGGIEGGEAIIRVYCMKENLFSIKKERKKKKEIGS